MVQLPLAGVAGERQLEVPRAKCEPKREPKRMNQSFIRFIGACQQHKGENRPNFRESVIQSPGGGRCGKRQRYQFKSRQGKTSRNTYCLGFSGTIEEHQSSPFVSVTPQVELVSYKLPASLLQVLGPVCTYLLACGIVVVVVRSFDCFLLWVPRYRSGGVLPGTMATSAEAPPANGGRSGKPGRCCMV